jgi:hypothetical protein
MAKRISMHMGIWIKKGNFKSVKTHALKISKTARNRPSICKILYPLQNIFSMYPDSSSVTSLSLTRRRRRAPVI